MTRRALCLLVVAVGYGAGGLALAADMTVLGIVAQVKDPEPGVAAARRALGVRSHEGYGLPIVGDPTQAGATITFFVHGTSWTSETFALPQGTDPVSGRSFWRASRAGFVYTDPHGVNGAVRSVRLQSRATAFDLKAVAVGKLGPITLVPPAPGTAACVRFDVGGGDSYHVLFPEAPGVVTRNTEKAFVLRYSPYRGFCPDPNATTTTSTSSTTTSSTATTSVSTTTSTITTSTSVTTTTVDPALCGDGIREPGEECDAGAQCTAACKQTIPSCCKKPDACMAAPLYSLNFYLMQHCDAFFPGSSALAGQLCAADGSCADVPIAVVPICCQLPGECFDGTQTSTVGLWYFQNFCRGSRTGTFIIGAACGAGGTCVPQ